MSESTPRDQESLSDPALWVERHGDALYRFALTRVRNAGTAQDLVQDTFLAALRGKGEFRGRSDELTWMISILKRKVIDHFRRLSREQLTDKDVEELEQDPDFRSGSWELGPRPVEWAATPDNSLERAEFRRFLRRCLSELPEALSRAFTLREIEEISPEKVCNVLNISATNLRVMMYRARKALRRCLETHWLEVRRR